MKTNCSFALLLAAFLLSGCSGAVFRDNQEGQSGQGKDRAEARWCETAAGEARELCELVIDIGRDKDNVAVTIEHPSGLKVTYQAQGATGVDQARLRAEVEKRLGEVQGETFTPEAVLGIVDGAVQAILGL